jgi:arylsulfatase
MLIDIKLDPFELTTGAPGHFQWQAEKSWILPLLMPYARDFAASMKAFPPRQKGTGIGAAAAASYMTDTGTSD